MKNFLLLLLITLSCTQSTTFTELDKEKVRLEVIEMLDNYHVDIKADGLMSKFAYLDSSADFFWMSLGYHSALSYDSVRTILTGNAVLFQAVDFS